MSSAYEGLISALSTMRSSSVFAVVSAAAKAAVVDVARTRFLARPHYALTFGLPPTSYSSAMDAKPLDFGEMSRHACR